MALVRQVPEQVVRGGLAATYLGSLSASNTYQVANNGRVILHFKKSGAGACTVTITTPGTIDGLAVTDRTVNVPATTGDVFIGPFPQTIYNNGINDVEYTLSEVTGLTVAVLRV